MDSNFPNLNLEKFAHSYDSFFDSARHVLWSAYNDGTLAYILPDNICKQYKFSEYSRSHLGLMNFLDDTYISREEKEEFVSLINQILTEVLKLYNKQSYDLMQIHDNLENTLIEFIDLVISVNEPEVFDLEFYYDKADKIFKKKLDEATVGIINQNTADLSSNETNKIRYEECVAEFLSFRKDAQTSKHLFYNQSLDKIKRIIENVLENDYRKEDGTFPKLSHKKQISNILFDVSHPEFESRIDYVLSNIHHEQGGQPKKFTEKEYVYLWLELNQILYLLNRYKK